MEKSITEQSKYRVSKNLYIISIVCFSLISITTYSDNIVYFTQAVSGLTLSIFSLILLTKTKNYKLPVYISITLSIFVIFLSFMTSSFANNQGDLFWILVITLFAFYMVGKVWAVVYISFNIGAMVTTKLLQINGAIELPFQSVEPHLLSELNYVINLIACCILFLYLMDQILKEYESTQLSLIKTNQVLSVQDAEKSTMLREIHHRVKNNLQVIISLLRLQLFQLDHDEKVSRPFQDSINRITTMALIHEKMYKGDKINDLSVENYVTDLTTDIVQTYATTTRVQVKVTSTIDQLKMDDLVPFSLILNELITNSIKHGFKDKTEGEIDITVKNTDIGFDFIYRDSGTWKENLNEQNFGLELIETLNGHFDGIFRKKTGENGTEFTFNFKVY